MPKISKQGGSINIDGNNVYISYDVMYSTTTGFYAVIPKDFDVAFNDLDDATRTEFSAKVLRKGKYAKGDIIGNVVVGDSEAEIEKKMTAICKHLGTLQVTKRDVIIMWFKDAAKESQYWNRERQQTKTHYPVAGFSIQFTYAEERAVGKGLPKYYEKRDHRWCSVDYTPGHDRGALVMADTPERRMMLEKIHEASKHLSKQLLDITKDEKALTAFIKSKQQLKLS